MKLLDRYLEVEVKSKNNKFVSFGIFDKSHWTYGALTIFCDDGVLQYNVDEAKENFRLFNPKDGSEYDISKLMGTK